MDKRVESARLRAGTENAHPTLPRLSRSGHTLIEALVVTSVIALLTSILLPALNKANANAKGFMCAARLNQLGKIWKMYTEKNNDQFMNRGCGYSRGAVSWFHCIRDYYSDLDLLYCPMAVKTQREGGRNPHMAWENTTDFGLYYRGSYGINLWVANGSSGCGGAGPEFGIHCWRTPNVKGASYVPLLLCSQWKDIQPYPSDEPLPYESLVWTPGPYDEMRRPCIKRHAPYHVQVLLLDFSVGRKTIKQLWRLKWHRNWPPDDPLPVWPDWMADVPEPD